MNGTRVLLVALTLGLGAVHPCVAQGAFARGVQLYRAGQYAEAAAQLRQAERDEPQNPLVYLWGGMAWAASGDDKYQAGSTWTRMPISQDAITTKMVLQGLHFWRRGSPSDAEYWFKNALNYPHTRGYAPARALLTRLTAGSAAPEPAEWPALAALQEPGAAPTPPLADAAPATGGQGGAGSSALERRGGPLPTGSYACRDWDGEQILGGGSRWTNRFDVTGTGTYAFRGTRTVPGTLRYSAATGAIQFTGGPFAPSGGGTITGEFGRQNGKPVIVLHFRLPSGNARELCFLQSS